MKKATKGKKSRPSKEKKAAGAKNAAAMKKAGKGIFAPKTLSPALAAICGKKVMPRTEVTKQIWVYIKKKVRRFFFLHCRCRFDSSEIPSKQRTAQQGNALIHVGKYVCQIGRILLYSAAQGLNKGRIISPDATLKTIFPVASSACTEGRDEKRKSENRQEAALRRHSRDPHS